jgi:hypothetical protein
MAPRPFFRRRRRGETTVVAVLGMHRSGTSWLTGSLQQLGLDLGEVNTRAPFNAKGNRESRFLMNLHERVLESNGGSWREPNYPNTWTPQQSRELSKHIRAMNKRTDFWGFKDPRTLLLIDEWRRQVPDLVRIGIYRHPVSVFRSLHGRHDDFTQDAAFALWRLYNERLIAEHQAKPFPIMRFDVEPPALLSQLLHMAQTIGLDTDKPSNFFDEGLVHNRDAGEIPSSVADVWSTLERLRIEAVV